MDGITVLSLFDGMSCGRLALDRAGIKVENYFASEIDKYAIQVAKHNYPNTKQLGDVTKVKIKLLCLSEVYSYICNYDYNLQSNISEWEMLYWLNKDFTFSAKIGTQKPNERQEVSKSSTIQRIEEVWFSKHGMGSIRKFGDDTRSGSNGEENDIRISQQLQCNKWGYDNDIYRRYKEENIRIPIRETQNGYSEKKNFRNIEETIFKGKESESCFGENEKSNVEERCSGKLLEREGEDKFSRKVKKEKRNGREKESDSIDEVIRELCRWDEFNGITKDYWNILRLHKEEQVTVVEYEEGLYMFKGRIDLCIGGSPCQGFSFAGKQLNFEDPRSKLFFEFVRLLKECKPKFFLLENVKMKKEYQDVISEHLGVEPIEINSALVSAQNRKRLYWTDIPFDKNIEDKGILLKDIVHEGNDNVLDTEIPNFNINPSHKGMNGDVYSTSKDKSRTLTTNKGEGQKISMAIAEYVVPFDKTLQILDKEVQRGKVGYFRKDSQANRVYYIHDKAITLTGEAGGGAAKMGQYLFGHTKKNSQGDRVYTENENACTLNSSSGGTAGKGNLLFGCITPDRVEKRQNGQRFNSGKKFYTLTAQDKHGVLVEGYIRKLTPIECERLQTVPDNEIICIFALCLDRAKNYVNAVEQNPKLLKLALSAEKTELNEFVKLVIQNTLQSNQQTKYIAQVNVDMQIQMQTNQCTANNQKDSNIIANNAANIAMCKNQNIGADFVHPNVFINITEGRITHFGMEELHQKGKHSTNQLNGNKPLLLSGNEIMELVKDVNAGITREKDMNFTFTTLSVLNTNSLELMLATYYLFAKSAIIGFTQNTTSQKSISVQFKINDGYTSIVSDTQRYRMLGNGWTVDVISHIFNHIKKEVSSYEGASCIFA